MQISMRQLSRTNVWKKKKTCERTEPAGSQREYIHCTYISVLVVLNDLKCDSVRLKCIFTSALRNTVTEYKIIDNGSSWNKPWNVTRARENLYLLRENFISQGLRKSRDFSSYRYNYIIEI